MSLVNGFFRFWWDFIVGDDWKIAAAVVSTLVLFAVVAWRTGATWVAPVAGLAVLAAFVASLALDVRKR
jgi:hypothetical protein